MAPLFRNRNEAVQILTQFGFSLSTVFQNIYYDVPNAIKEKRLKEAIGTMVGYMGAAAILALMKGQGPDDDDEDAQKVRWWIAKSMSQVTDSVPFIGQEVSHAWMRVVGGDTHEKLFEKSRYGVISSAIKAVDALTKETVSEEDYMRAFRYSMETGGYIMGVPLNEVMRYIQSVDEAAKEDENVLGAIAKTAIGYKER
jgi:hypothetical protein